MTSAVVKIVKENVEKVSEKVKQKWKKNSKNFLTHPKKHEKR